MHNFHKKWRESVIVRAKLPFVLLRFQVSNHRSILEPIELSMIAVDEDRAATRGFDLLSERVLTVAGIYGPNASGKSNVLDAIAWLSSAVAGSLRGWEDDIPRDAHRFGQGPVSPSVFDLEIVVDGVRFAYRLEVDDSAVLYESLDSYPERRRRNLFTREGQEVDFRRGLVGARAIQELLTPTTLALSAARRVGDSNVKSVGHMIAGMGFLGPVWIVSRLGRKFHPGFFVDRTMRLFVGGGEAAQARSEETGEDRPLTAELSSALDLLRLADPGIDDYEIAQEDSRYPDGPGRHRLRLVHRVSDEPVAFDLEDESTGTRTWFHHLGPVLAALRDGRILVFDEIDASLHPRLSARLLEIFQDPQTNPRGAQLVFTSHDASLLNALNRDEVWLTEKKSGSTRLVALAEFRGERVRKSLNLERAYLQGRFGAVPQVDQAEVRRALGLVSQARDGEGEG